MQFAEPERFAIGGGAAILVVLVALFARRRRPRAAVAGGVVLRVALLGAAAFVAAEPFRFVPQPLRPRVDLVVDASRSVDPAVAVAARAAAERWRRETGYEVRVFEFGAGLLAPGAAADAPERFASDPHEALAAAATSPAPGGGRLFLLTDGRTAPPDALRLPSFAEVSTTIVEAGPRTPRGVSSESLVVLPAGAAGGETLLEWRGVSEAAVAARAEIYRDGALFREAPVALPAGPFVERFSLGEAPPGRHVAAVRVALPAGGDAEPLDDEAGALVVVPAPLRVALFAPEARSALADALRAQGLAVDVRPDTALAAGVLALEGGVSVAVFDRIAPEALSEPTVLARCDAFVRRGGGLWFVPPDPETAKNALAPSPERAFLGLLPFVGREEVAPKPPEPPPPTPPSPEAPPGLKPPDPERKSIERREAPSLGLLLLIDASGSMRGQKLRLAQVAAVKAAEVLHPEDKVGVVAFNDGVIEVVPLGPADDLDFVRSQVSRIRAGGNTDFRAALEAARDVFFAEKLQVKHCILLSDGFSTTGGAFSKLARELRESGVTVSTVGVGVEADVEVLSNIAAEGGGKYQGAPDVAEVPQIFVVEAERILSQSKARRRGDPPREKPKRPEETPPPPEPAPDEKPAPPAVDAAEPPPKKTIPILPAWPAAYLKGVRPETSPGIFRAHRVENLRAAWPALKTEAGDPVFAHRYLGFGRVAAQSTPFEGPSAGPWLGWEDLSNFAAQTARFLAPVAPPERFAVRARVDERDVEIFVEDAEGETPPAEGYRLAARDQRGAPVAIAFERSGPLYRGRIPDGAFPRLLDVAVTSPEGPGEGRVAVVVPPPREIRETGIDARGLAAWRSALRGVVEPLPETLVLEPRVRETRRDGTPSWFPWVLLVFLVDLFVKRAWAGDAPPRAPAPRRA